MAANSLTYAIPQILAQGLVALRQQSVMARLVNRGYDQLAGDKGSTIDVPIPSAIAVQDVTPAATPPSTEGVAPTKISIVLNKWKEAPFYLSDKDIQEAFNGIVPMQATEAIKAIANQIDQDIMTLYKDIYGWSGTAGVTPFAADAGTYLEGRKVLAQQLAPLDPRFAVIDPAAEANALGLRVFADASFGGGDGVVINGQIGNKMGALWVMDQNVITHTAGTAASSTTDSTGYAIGLKTVTLASAGTGTFVVGDVITFTGDASGQTYVVTSGDTDVSNGGTISFEPGLKAALSAATHAITVKGNHTVNLLFHRDAFALAMRPFNDASAGLGMFQSMVDPVSGLALRLEVTREYKRTRWSFDALYGVGTARRELATRMAG